MSRQGFSLVEVIIAVVLLVTAGAALLHTGVISKRSLELSQVLSSKSDHFSIPLIHHDKGYHRSKKTLYDYLETSYTITDDTLRKYLKNIPVEYRQRELNHDGMELDGGITLGITTHEISVISDNHTHKVISFEIR